MSKKRKFPFTKTGVKFFEKVVLNEIFTALDNGEDLNNHDISIKIGRNIISVPMYADTYESIIEFLNKELEELEQC